MAAATDLKFNVSALDKASTAFIRMAQKVEKLSDKLEELDRKKAEPEIKVDVDRGLANIRRFGDSSSGIMSGALKIVSANALVMTAVVLAALAALPVAATVAATGITLALVGAFAAIGIAFAAQNKKIKKEFSGLKDHVVGQMKEISAPFQGTLMTIAEVARETFDSFAPHLKRSFKRMAPFVGQFVDDLGEAFEELLPSIAPMTEAFNAILDELGPRLGPLFENIAEALSDLAAKVEENAPLFASVFAGLLEIIPGVIKAITFLADLFVGAIIYMRITIQSLHEKAVTVFAGVGSAVLSFVGIAIKGFKFVADIFLGFVSILIHGAAKAFGWVPGVGPKLKKAAEGFDKFKQGVDDKLNDAIDKVNEWKDNLEKMPKEVKLKGDIEDLKRKLDDAKRRLKRAPDSKKVKIRAEIDQLKRKIRDAKGQLAQLRDKNVTVTLTTINREVFRRSGMKIRARGGPVERGDIALVGEEGPEIVQFGRSGTVIPAARSARMIRDVTPLGQAGGEAMGQFVATAVIDLGEGIQKVVDIKFERKDRALKRRVLAGTGQVR